MSRASILFCLFLWSPSAWAVITLNVTIVSNATCAYNNGIFVAKATGGAAPYTYSSNQLGMSNSSGIFANIPPGYYDVEVTDANGQTASGNASISNGSTPPFISAQDMDPTGCAKTDGSITVTGMGGVGPYMFSIDDGHTWQPGGVFSNLGTGFYNVWVRDADGCVSAPWDFLGGSYLDYQFYNIKPHYQVLLIPTCGLQLSAVPSGPVCGNNGTITFFAASGGTPPYTYSLDGVHFLPNNTNGYSGLAPGQYTVYARDATNLTITIALDIPSSCPVTANVVPATCGQNNGAITVTGSNGIAPHVYAIDGVHFQASVNFAGLAPGDYTVIDKDANGATSSTDVTVESGCPFVTAAAMNATCGQINGSIVVTAGGLPGPYQYSLDGGAHFQPSNSFIGLAPGPYTVTVNNGGGLLGTAGATIGNASGPLILANALAASCADNDGSITVGQQGGTPPFTYSIDGGSFQASGLFSGLDTGMRTVVVRDVNGCLSSQSLTVPLLDQLTLNAGNDLTICEGVDSPLRATSNAVSFSWAPAAGLSDAAVLQPLASPQTTTQYTITALNGLCSRTGSVTVFVNPAPTADPGPDTLICSGQSVRLQGSGGLSYQWSPASWLDNAGIADPTVVRPPTSIVYKLTVKDGNGCASLNPALVHVNVTPPGKVFAGNDTVVVIGQPLQLHATDVNHSGFTQYQWSPADGLNDPSSQNPVVNFSGNITYTVDAFTPAGCEGEGSVHVKIYSHADIFVPNAFTPNGDGHNDLLKAIPAGIGHLQYFAVYNRRGQQIFLSTNPDKGWDGTINGKPQSAGVYVWAALGTDYKGNTIRRSGTVVLIR